MPTFRDLKSYLEHDGGWDEVPNLARGRRRVGDHRRYRKTLSDGTILRTKVPHAPADEIGPDLLGHIVRDQLRTTMEHFRDVISGRATESATTAKQGTEPVPGWLISRLIHTAGIPEEEVHGMSPRAARARWERFTRGNR